MKYFLLLSIVFFQINLFAVEDDSLEDLEEASNIVKTLEKDLDKCWDSKVKQFIDC